MKTIRIHRNAHCGSCARISTVTRALDWLNRTESSTEIPPSGPVPPGRIVVQDLRTGQWFHGAAAIQKVSFNIPAYFLYGLLLYIPALAHKIDRPPENIACPLPETSAAQK